MKKSILLTCLLSTFHASVTVAQETKAPQWQGEGELGYTAASGNSDSKNLNASLNIGREAGSWKHSASLDLIQAEADDEDSANSKVFRARSEYAFGEKSNLFGATRYEDDQFSGFDFQASITGGAGHSFVDNETHSFEASAGLGFRRLRDQNTREDEDETIVTAEVIYEYRISETATLSENLLIEAGDENVYTESETALASKINGNLALKLSYLYKRNSEVPANTDKTDEIVTVSLVYGF